MASRRDSDSQSVYVRAAAARLHGRREARDLASPHLRDRRDFSKRLQVVCWGEPMGTRAPPLYEHGGVRRYEVFEWNFSLLKQAQSVAIILRRPGIRRFRDRPSA